MAALALARSAALHRTVRRSRACRVLPRFRWGRVVVCRWMASSAIPMHCCITRPHEKGQPGHWPGRPDPSAHRRPSRAKRQGPPQLSSSVLSWRLTNARRWVIEGWRQQSGGKSSSPHGASSRSRNAVLRLDLHDEARDQGAIEPVGDDKRLLCDADWNRRQ
jgi:hypothetical protein